MQGKDKQELRLGGNDLRLPEELRDPLMKHLAEIRTGYINRGWGGRVGFGTRPAVVVVDLARSFVDHREWSIGCNLDSVVENTCRLLKVARLVQIPIFFTTAYIDPADPPYPRDKKHTLPPGSGLLKDERFDLDPRLERRPDEKVIFKKYASVFKCSNFQEMLTALNVDTLIVTGCSTSHCISATCRDAAASFHVIIPREAVGDRCELLHEVNLTDIDICLGDVIPVIEVLTYLKRLRK